MKKSNGTKVISEVDLLKMKFECYNNCQDRVKKQKLRIFECEHKITKPQNSNLTEVKCSSNYSLTD